MSEGCRGVFPDSMYGAPGKYDSLPCDSDAYHRPSRLSPSPACIDMGPDAHAKHETLQIAVCHRVRPYLKHGMDTPCGRCGHRWGVHVFANPSECADGRDEYGTTQCTCPDFIEPKPEPETTYTTLFDAPAHDPV